MLVNIILLLESYVISICLFIHDAQRIYAWTTNLSPTLNFSQSKTQYCKNLFFIPIMQLGQIWTSEIWKLSNYTFLFSVLNTPALSLPARRVTPSSGKLPHAFHLTLLSVVHYKNDTGTPGHKDTQIWSLYFYFLYCYKAILKFSLWVNW